MSRIGRRDFLLFIILAANIHACMPSPVINNPAAGIPVSGGEPSGACANPFYPVIQGATWIYSSTDSPDGPFLFTDDSTAKRVLSHRVHTCACGSVQAEFTEIF
jgi:hypothetical protein